MTERRENIARALWNSMAGRLDIDQCRRLADAAIAADDLHQRITDALDNIETLALAGARARRAGHAEALHILRQALNA